MLSLFYSFKFLKFYIGEVRSWSFAATLPPSISISAASRPSLSLRWTNFRVFVDQLKFSVGISLSEVDEFCVLLIN
ncbi:hypothetical protein ACHQM5_004373 [Ranunculus cassubicifolius]